MGINVVSWLAPHPSCPYLCAYDVLVAGEHLLLWPLKGGYVFLRRREEPALSVAAASGHPRQPPQWGRQAGATYQDVSVLCCYQVIAAFSFPFAQSKFAQGSFGPTEVVVTSSLPHSIKASQPEESLPTAPSVTCRASQGHLPARGCQASQVGLRARG